MRLVKAARLTQNITVATAAVVPDSAPRPSEQAPEPCKRLSGLSGRRLRCKQTAPGRSSHPSRVFASSRRGRGCEEAAQSPGVKLSPHVHSARARSPGRPPERQPRASAVRAAVWAAVQTRPRGRRPFSAQHEPPCLHRQAVQHFWGVSGSLQAVHTRSSPTCTLNLKQRSASAFSNSGETPRLADTRPVQRAGPGRRFGDVDGLAGLLLESRPSLPQASASFAGARKSTAREQKLQAGDLSQQRARRNLRILFTATPLGEPTAGPREASSGEASASPSPSQIDVARAFTHCF